MRSSTVASALLAATLLLSGCGGGSPEDASKKDFCAQLKKVNSQKTWKTTQKAVSDLEGVGTPKDISAKARAGFVDLIGYTEAAKDRATLVKKIEKISKTERARLEAFDTYITKTCGSGS